MNNPPGKGATKLVWITVSLSILGASVVFLAAVLPLDIGVKQAVITMVLGFLTPAIAALIAASVQQVHLAVNSRLTDLLEVTKQLATERERARNKAEENEELPEICDD